MARRNASSKTFYDILGVQPTTPREEIRAQWLNCCWEFHPDRHGGDAARMAEINEAWNILKDPKKRKAYDKELSVFKKACEQCGGKGKVSAGRGLTKKCNVCKGEG